MKIADIKKEARKKLEETLPSIIESGVEIGTKIFFLKSHDGSIRMVKSDEIWKNHLVINLEYFHEEYRYPDVRTDEVRGSFSEAYKTMVNYWKDYAAIKGFEGIIIQSIYSRYPELYVKEDLTESEFNVLKEQRKIKGPWDDASSNDVFLGAFISDELKHRIARYKEVSEFLAKKMNEDVLFKIDSPERGLERLFSERVSFNYVGEKLGITINYLPTEDEKWITILNSDLDVESVTVIGLSSYLKDIDESRSLVNIIESPMENYKNVMNGIPSYEFNVQGEVPEELKKDFEAMTEILGGWKTVEMEFAKLENVKAESCMEIKDNASKKEVLGWKSETEDYVFYFLVFKSPLPKYGTKTERRVKMHEKEQGNTEVKRLISEFLVSDV